MTGTGCMFLLYFWHENLIGINRTGRDHQSVLSLNGFVQGRKTWRQRDIIGVAVSKGAIGYDGYVSLSSGLSFL